jgi:putative redox protein
MRLIFSPNTKETGMNEKENTAEDRMEPLHIATTLIAGENRRMIARARGHEIVMDARKEWGGDNAGPTPPECLVMALGGCLLNICRILAMEKHIVLDDIRITVTGDIDPSRAFGIPTEERAGFSDLSARLEMTSDLTPAEKEDFRRELINRCPLCDTIGSPTPLQITFAK